MSSEDVPSLLAYSSLRARSPIEISVVINCHVEPHSGTARQCHPASLPCQHHFALTTRFTDLSHMT